MSSVFDHGHLPDRKNRDVDGSDPSCQWTSVNLPRVWFRMSHVSSPMDSVSRRATRETDLEPWWWSWGCGVGVEGSGQESPGARPSSSVDPGSRVSRGGSCLCRNLYMLPHKRKKGGGKKKDM